MPLTSIGGMANVGGALAPAPAGTNPNSVLASLSGYGGAGGASYSQQTSTPAVIPGMMDLYNQALARNQSLYGQYLNTYGQAGANQQAALPGIFGQYYGLAQQVGGTLGQGGGWGVATPAAQQIGASFAQNQGMTQQEMINRGLGNSTVLANLQDQNTQMATQAYGNLGAQLANQYASYQNQIGMASLSAQMQGLGMESDLAKAQAQGISQYQTPYPSQLVGTFGQQTSTGTRPPAAQNYGGGGLQGPIPGSQGDFGGSAYSMGDNSGGGYQSMTTGSGPNQLLGTPPAWATQSNVTPDYFTTTGGATYNPYGGAGQTTITGGGSIPQDMGGFSTSGGATAPGGGFSYGDGSWDYTQGEWGS